MKAIIYTKYGSPDVLKLTEITRPTPKGNEVLVKVHAASVNSWDSDLVSGKPYIYRLMSGLFKPKHKIIGSDIAGTVEICGDKVVKFSAGDAVYGDISGIGFGAFAEYVCVPENLLAAKPKNLSFEQAASIPQAGVLALQGLRNYGKINDGMKVLINGAGGGVGTFAIQLAKLYNAEITAVDREDKLDYLQSLGVNHVIDYLQNDYTNYKQQYDIILDVVVQHSMKKYSNVLSSHGIFVFVGGKMSAIFSVLFHKLFNSNNRKKKFDILAHEPNSADLTELTTLLESEKIIPIIDKVFPLNETAAAVRYLEEGHAKGKVVITIC